MKLWFLDISFTVKITDIIIATSFLCTILAYIGNLLLSRKKLKRQLLEDEKRKDEIDALKKTADTQVEISKKLNAQFLELEKQTNTFQEQTIQLQNQTKEVQKQTTEFESQTKEIQAQTKELQSQSTESKNQTVSLLKSNEITKERLLIEKRRYEDETSKRYEELEKYYASIILSLPNPLKEQAEVFENFSKKLLEEKCQDYFLQEITTLKTINLEKIDEVELYKIFVSMKGGNSDEKIKTFLKLQRNVYHIKQEQEKYPKQFLTFLALQKEFQLKWNKNVQGIQHIYEEMLQEVKITPVTSSNDQFFLAFRQIILDWTQHENSGVNIRDPFFLKEHYLEPILKLCKTNHQDKRTPKILRILKPTLSSFNDYVHAKNFYSVLFKEKGVIFSEIGAELESLLKSLQKNTAYGAEDASTKNDNSEE